MWLVLCHTSDDAALWAYDGLVDHGLAPIELITAEMLACSLRWIHRIGPKCRHVEFTLADGRQIDGTRVRGTLNRLQWIPPEALSVAEPDERQYASQELYAFFMGWLYSLPEPVVNGATAQGLSGRWRYPTEWQCLAGQAGLPTRPFRIGGQDHDAVVMATVESAPDKPPRRTVMLLDGKALGEGIPSEVEDGCRQLGQLAGARLLGIEFEVSPQGSWVFINASVTPDLRLGGKPLLAELAAFLRGEPSASEVPRT